MYLYFKVYPTEPSSNAASVGLLSLTFDVEIQVVQQAILLTMIVARWMLPKAKLTRDELSQLLLLYLGLAADIADFFAIFEIDGMNEAYRQDFVYTVLAVWTWSLLQFTIPLTATANFTRKDKENTADHVDLDKLVEFDHFLYNSLGEKEKKNYMKDYEKRLKKKDEEILKREKARIKAEQKRRSEKRKQEEGKPKSGKFFRNTDAWSIWFMVLMQDGPFLTVRLYAIIALRAYSFGIFYFTVKNAIIIILQMYRFIILMKDKSEKEKKEQEKALKDHQAALQPKLAKSRNGVPSLEDSRNGHVRNLPSPFYGSDDGRSSRGFLNGRSLTLEPQNSRNRPRTQIPNKPRQNGHSTGNLNYGYLP